MQTPAPGDRFAGFEVLSSLPLPEFRGAGVRCRHLGTGLEAFHLACDDPENLFAFAFRTPPPDDSGVAHILEHSVLCGSRRFPVKDPFVVLLKSSLQTFLNAFTFPDKTVYPAASQLEKDFFNLLEVYGDAVFFPRLDPEVFRQEGHRLEFNPEGSLRRVGVVYNEMKGVFSSAEAIVADLSLRSLFPGGPYGRESGGLPVSIPSLTYEGLREFHRRYYHPANCLLFLYGNIPTEKTLGFLAESFLEGFAAAPAAPGIPAQARWSAPRFAETTYPVEEAASGANLSSITLNWLTVQATDPLRLLAMEVLGEVLVGNPGSPLSRALLESGLGQDLSPATGLDTELAELAFTVGLRGCQEGRVQEVEGLILRTMESLVTGGIPEELVRAAVHRVEFRNREIVRGGRPFSLALMRRSLRGWLHGREPELTLEYRKWMELLRGELAAGPYLEALLRSQLLDNPHRSTVLVRPDPQAAARQLAEERAGLDELAAGLGPDERRRIEEENRLLACFQESPDRPEDLARLPRLRRADLPRAVETVPTSELTPAVLFHDLHTNGVVYLDLALEVSDLDEESSALLPLWARAVCGSGLPGLPWHETASRLTLLAGGFSAALGADTPAGGTRPAQHLVFRVKALEENLAPALELVASLLVEADFRDLERLQMLVLELRNDLKSALVPGGSYFASLRAGGRLSEAIGREERWKGVSQLAHLRRYGGQPEMQSLAAELERLRAALVARSRLFLNLTCDADCARRAGPELERFLARLPSTAPPAGGGGGPSLLANGQRLEALLTSTNVNFAALALPASPFGTAESVQETILAHYLSTGFLWEQVRMKGGAYGASASVSSLERVFSFASYRDPNIALTFNSFRQALEAARDLPLSAEDFEQVLIGAAGKEERPMAPGERGYTALKRTLLAISDRMRQDRRDRLLASAPGDLAAAAGRLAASFAQGYSAVLTGRQALESSGLRDLDLVEIPD